MCGGAGIAGDNAHGPTLNRGVEPYLLSISVSMAVIKDFFDKLYEGSRTESSIYVVKNT